MKKTVVFGAGNIGRGFLGQMLCEAGHEVVFVDINPELIRLLNERRRYEIEIIGETDRRVEVRGVRAVDSHQVELVSAEVATADMLATAVGAGALKYIAPTIAEGISRRIAAGKPPLNIVLCENLNAVDQIMRAYVEESLSAEDRLRAAGKVAYVEAVVARMVPVLEGRFDETDPLLVVVEPYNILPVDAGTWLGEAPDIEGFLLCDHFQAYVERKLFVHNAGHALAAYEGYLKGYRYIYEAIEDSEVLHHVKGALRESRLAMESRHGLDRLGLQENIEDLLRRFGSRKLCDTVLRVGRDPLRKLGPHDRLVGAARAVESCGMEPSCLARGIAAALRFAHPSDPSAVAMQQRLEELGPGATLTQISGIEPGEPLFDRVMAVYAELG